MKVSYRNGKPLAAYISLPDSAGEKSVRTEEPKPGILVDYSRDGKAIGVEITSPSTITLKALNDVLSMLGQRKIREADLAPLNRSQTNDDDHQRLLFLYGMAASLAQQLEKNLLVAFVASKKASNERLSKEDRTEIARDPSSTMLITQICRHLEVPSKERRLITDSWSKRNYLFHSFIISKEDLSDTRHVKHAKQQLQDMIVWFRKANTVAMTLRAEMLDISGLSVKRVERDLEEIKEAVSQ
jgi:uncharacterized protein YuzE